ncbi:MAG: biotin--[acetyl-CoA-carboxylase] ligase [Candidatus Omnitrophica bacterium]|nr:biotin--[acetyl-CoA-carboxylase] ligase [Candidatus Omnitrophota bacterium]MCM8815917.1 biotin--[acetyl-CoA-carboxylase] ligase [Candidatus Omnitrophota bacterium]
MDVLNIAGTRVFFIEETTSTMDVARSLCKEQNEFAVVAKKQTKGRGRQGSVWISDEGGLWVSVVWRETGQNLQKYLFMISAISIVETLSFFGISAKIKLPNDIYARNRKIAGILIENLKDCVIIGIGINVNNRIEDKMDQAVSCSFLLGHSLDLKKVLDVLLSNLNLAKALFEKDAEGFLSKIKGLLIE